MMEDEPCREEAPNEESPMSREMQEKRVKLYVMTDNGDWDDLGTGFVSVQSLPGTNDPGFLIESEIDGRVMLQTAIRGNQVYQRQIDTIISWVDPSGPSEFAISFQDYNGAQQLWERILRIRGESINEGGDMFLQSDSDAPFASVDLPDPELKNLDAILKTLSTAGPSKDAIVQHLLSSDYLVKLSEVFATCEDLEDSASLAIFFQIAKVLLSYDEPPLLELMTRDDLITFVVGSLEYDPALKTKLNFRDDLCRPGLFREPVKISDPECVQQIHLSFRLSFLKDVVMARFIEEGPYGTLREMVGAANCAILRRLRSDSSFIDVLKSQCSGIFADDSNNNNNNNDNENKKSGGVEDLSLQRKRKGDDKGDDDNGDERREEEEAAKKMRTEEGEKEEERKKNNTDADEKLEEDSSSNNKDNTVSPTEKPAKIDHPPLHRGDSTSSVKSSSSSSSSSQSRLERKRESFLFLQEMCEIAKHVADYNRGPFFQTIAEHGFFDVFAANLSHPDARLRTACCESVSACVYQQPSLVYRHSVQRKNSPNSLVQAICRAIASEDEACAKPSIVDLVRFLLDPSVIGPPQQQPLQPNTEREAFIDIFYEDCFDILITPFDSLPSDMAKRGESAEERRQRRARDSTRSLLTDLFAFCLQHHGLRMKECVVRLSIMHRISPMLAHRDKYMALAAVRFLRACLGGKDSFYPHYIVKNDLMHGVMDVLKKSHKRENLLSCALAELLTFIKGNDIRPLITYIVEKYRSVLDEASSMCGVKELLTRYDQLAEYAAAPPEQVPAASTAKRGWEAPSLSLMSAENRRQMARYKELSDEESYFDNDDDDNNGHSGDKSSHNQATSSSSSIDHGNDSPPPFLSRKKQQEEDEDLDKSPPPPLRRFRVSSPPIAIPLRQPVRGKGKGRGEGGVGLFDGEGRKRESSSWNAS